MDLTAPPVSLTGRSTSTTSLGTTPVRIRTIPVLGFRRASIILVMTISLAVGIFFRLYPTATHSGPGFDEYRYALFLKQIQRTGLAGYDTVVRVYVEQQYKRTDAVVPATRIGLLVPAYLCGELLKQKPYDALRLTAGLASILLLGVTAFFAYRLGGATLMMGATLVVATAPLQIQLAQHTFIDACFSLWAIAVLWLAWENLRQPRHWGWLCAYGFALAMLVLTKESAVFVMIAICGILTMNYFYRFGTVTPQLLLVTVAAPIVIGLLLVNMVGGITEWIHFWRMFAEKSRANSYSFLAQDGPWYRYLVDFILMSPLIVILAIGRVFNLRAADRAEVLMTSFLVLSFFCMANITYGISLRYAAYWDIPLALLACSQVLRLSKQFRRIRPSLLIVGLFLVLGACNLRQYDRFFVEGEIYDPITSQLIQAADFEK